MSYRIVGFKEGEKQYWDNVSNSWYPNSMCATLYDCASDAESSLKAAQSQSKDLNITSVRLIRI